MLNRVYRISRQASRAYASNSRKSSAQLCQDKVQPTQASRRSLQTSSCASSITSNTTTKTSKRSKSTASGSWFNDQFRGEVTLVSYNVLSQSHLQKHRNLYQGVDEKYLDWEHRQELLAKFFTNQVKNNHANVFCLQEVDRRHVDTFYRPLFKKLGFSFVFHQRPDIDATKSHSLTPKIESFPDGVAIAYDSSLFMKGRSDFVDFCHKDEGSDERGPGSYTGRQEAATNLNYSHVGILQKLTEVSSRKEFVVGTTHLAFNPFLGDLKLAQLMIWLHRLQRMTIREDPSNPTPAILTGDFNIHATSPIFKDFINNGFFNCPEQTCEALSHQIPDEYLEKLLPNRRLRPLSIPPIPKSLRIDYRNLGDLRPGKTMGEKKREDSGFEDYDISRSNVDWGNIGTKVKKMWDNKTGPLLEHDRHLEATNLQADLYHGSLESYVGHLLKLKMPYVAMHERSAQKPYSTLLKDPTSQNHRPILVDHIIMSNQVPVYNYLTLPVTDDYRASSGILDAEEPSDHLPIGINFGL